MRILIDADRCTGHGRCYSLVPELFDSDDQGHSVVLVPGPLTPAQEVAAGSAVTNCPERAIELVER